MPFTDHFFKNTRRLAEFIRESGEIARHYGTTRPAILGKASHLFFEKGFAPWEALHTGVLSPNVSASAMDACKGKFRLLRLQARINPGSLDYLTADKAMFYAYCAGLGLPAPVMYGVFDGNKGWDSKGRILTETSDWERFIENELPHEFVVKPARSAYGHEVNVYVRKSGIFIDASNKELSSLEIYERISSNPRYNKFVITERLHGNPELVRLSKTPYLQCVRLTTLVGNDGLADVYNAFLKVITGDQAIDNFEDGLTGNLICPVNLETGGVYSAITTAPRHFGSMLVTRHPRTDETFSEFNIPMWAEATALVRRAALQFLPLRTIGWDVAITPSGPVLVEGNTRYDPFNRIAVTAPEGASSTKKIAQLMKLLEEGGNAN